MTSAVFFVLIVLGYAAIKIAVKRIKQEHEPEEIDPPMIPLRSVSENAPQAGAGATNGGVCKRERVISVDGETMHKIEFPLTDRQKEEIEASTLGVVEGKIFMHYPSDDAGREGMDEQERLNREVFFWDVSETFEAKSLPDTFAESAAKLFILGKIPESLSLLSGTVMPWFGKPGGGTKYFFKEQETPVDLSMLAKNGSICYVKKIDVSELNEEMLHDGENYLIKYDQKALEFKQGRFHLDNKPIPMWLGFEMGRISVFELLKDQ